jgi:hypothetical protein
MAQQLRAAGYRVRDSTMILGADGDDHSIS